MTKSLKNASAKEQSTPKALGKDSTKSLQKENTDKDSDTLKAIQICKNLQALNMTPKEFIIPAMSQPYTWLNAFEINSNTKLKAKVGGPSSFRKK
ncbi:hypothetical protein PtA15_9A658 [Puccinia triticina]|uniref:Uncharacterized protein n=1 Tax=Puccinia triticina TaxID=208348 RepID=A0ABY7CTF3_9BASI|nr:uncharacterized protein PtA15_9A658 [Puccinia triticina]WAQ88531.1 hypothetical protein PtA15_9A658 [Puccinia triticina]